MSRCLGEVLTHDRVPTSLCSSTYCEPIETVSLFIDAKVPPTRLLNNTPKMFVFSLHFSVDNFRRLFYA